MACVWQSGLTEAGIGVDALAPGLAGALFTLRGFDFFFFFLTVRINTSSLLEKVKTRTSWILCLNRRAQSMVTADSSHNSPIR
jgi:hypothetical protein